MLFINIFIFFLQIHKKATDVMSSFTKPFPVSNVCLAVKEFFAVFTRLQHVFMQRSAQRWKDEYSSLARNVCCSSDANRMIVQNNISRKKSYKLSKQLQIRSS